MKCLFSNQIDILLFFPGRSFGQGYPKDKHQFGKDEDSSM